MRLWSLHPRYLDARGLVALWREGLLAQKVLGGGMRGYRNHPQLERFRAHPSPGGAIGAYLLAVCDEASARSYNFDRGKIEVTEPQSRLIEVTEGQLRYEASHLTAKLESRDPKRLEQLCRVADPDPHPLFVVVTGPVASWERVGK